MAKNNNKISNGVVKDIERMQDAVNDIMRNVSDKVTGVDLQSDREIGHLSNILNSTINSEMNSISNVSSMDLHSFLADVMGGTSGGKQANNAAVMDNYFKNANSEITTLFEQRASTDADVYRDLNFIASHIYELKEAVATTRDAIVSADSNNQFGRTISFEGLVDKDKETAYINEIKAMEKEYKIQKKLRNHIVPKTLTFGEYNVYSAPYAEILNELGTTGAFSKGRRVGTVGSMGTSVVSAKESLSYDNDHPVLESADVESIMGELNVPFDNKNKKDKMGAISNFANDVMNNISIVNECSAYDEFSAVFETNVSVQELIDAERLKKHASTVTSQGRKRGSDGGVHEFGSDEFNNIKGARMKLLNSDRLIPAMIMEDLCIGYYYAIDRPIVPSQNGRTPAKTRGLANSLFTNVDQHQNDEIEKRIVTKLADGIIKKFDKKFLEENIKFRETIVAVLAKDDLYKKGVRFQFIPASHITKFKIDEDENNKGQSMLKDAIFPAKLYLSILVFKILTMLNNGADTHYYYVKSSRMDRDVTGKVQKVIRGIANQTISYNDLMGNNSLISKISAGRKIVMPVGEGDNKGVEQEIVSGQDVPLDTEFLEKLKTWAVNATNTPSIITNYVNEADYAKTIEMGQAKYARTVTGYQTDLADSATELYKKMAHACTSIPPEVIETLTFTFNPPKSLMNTVNNDLLQSVEQNVETQVNAYFGKESELTPETLLLKDKLTFALIEEETPNIAWDKIKEMARELKLQAAAETLGKSIKKKNSEAADAEEDTTSDEY